METLDKDLLMGFLKNLSQHLLDKANTDYAEGWFDTAARLHARHTTVVSIISEIDKGTFNTYSAN